MTKSLPTNITRLSQNRAPSIITVYFKKNCRKFPRAQVLTVTEALARARERGLDIPAAGIRVRAARRPKEPLLSGSSEVKSTVLYVDEIPATK